MAVSASEYLQSKRKTNLQTVRCHKFYLSQSRFGSHSVSQKCRHAKTLYNIFDQAKYISLKFCQFVASLNPHIVTHFRRFTVSK